MVQFDPQMVAQMLMQPVGKESLDNSIAEENFFQPIEIPTQGMVAPLDMQGGFFKGFDTDNQDMTVEPGMLLPFERTAEGSLQFATPQLVAGILEGLQQAGQTIQKGVSGDPMFVPVDGRLSEQAIDEITNLGLTMGGTAYTGSSLIPGLVPEGVLASTLKGGSGKNKNVIQLDVEKKKRIEQKLKENTAPRDTTSGHAADGVPAQFGPPAHNMNLSIDEEFTPEGFSTFSTNVGNDYENLKFFVSSSRGTKEYDEEVAFLRKLKEIKGNPNAEVTIYRASPTDDLRPGDLITPIKSDAEFYVEQSKITRDDIIEAQRKARLDTDEPIDLKKEKNIRTMDKIIGMFQEPEVSPSKVFTYKVKAKDIRWDGNNGLIRWGYFPDDVASDVNVAGIAKVEPPTETKQGIIAFHASPDEIKGKMKFGDGVGIHFAKNSELATNAAIKSKMDVSGSRSKDVVSNKFVLNASDDQIVDIEGDGAFDFYEILEDLFSKKKIKEKTFNDAFDKLEELEGQGDITEMYRKQNEVMKKALESENIKVLRYFNKFDSGPNYKDIEKGDFSNKVKPDFSYMVFDNKIIDKSN